MSVKGKLKEWARGLSGYNEKGEEIPDPTPVEAPLDFEAPIPLAEEIRRLVSRERQLELNRVGLETFEESDDFEIPDDPVDRSSPWEDELVGKVWTRENEVRAGIVSEPDYVKAKELVAKAQQFIADFEAKQNAARGGASDSHA